MIATDLPDDLLAATPLETVLLEVAGRHWRVTAVVDQDALLDIAERFPNIPYGLLLWESALALAQRLGRPLQGPTLAGARVLELGAGVGLAGLVAQSLGARVVQTDHEPVALALARRNAAANGVIGIVQFVADWRRWDHDDCYDLIIGADIVYDQSVHADLARIFERNLAPGGRLLLADPDRPRTLGLLAGLEDAGWRFELEVAPVEGLPPGHGKPPVQVSILTAWRH